MIIKSISVNYGFFSRTFDFADNFNLIYSTQNSVGKTTLLRLIFWGLGYDIPSTKKFNFNKCFTRITLELDNLSSLTIDRSKDSLVVNDDIEEKLYSLPMEAKSLHAQIFKTDNLDILNNILGAIYLDQEKGWTLLNRGCVIGKIPFQIESLVRGLSNTDCADLFTELKKIELELAKYRKMLDVAKYQRQVNELGGNIAYLDRNEELQNKIAALRFQQSQLKEELQQITVIIKENNSFKNYIEKMKLTVISPNTGEEIPVNKTTINGFNDIQQFALARKRVQLYKLQEIARQIDDLTSELDETDTLVKVETIIEKFDSQILSVPINEIAVKNVIDQLCKRKKDINAAIESRTKSNNSIIYDIYKTAYSYLQELKVDKFADTTENYLFTHDLKSLSGAVLHLTAFAFRLAYIKAIENVLHISLPIVIDSPSGKEVERENVEKMMGILARDFSGNQIIIASIYQYNIKNIKIHIIEKSLLGESF